LSKIDYNSLYFLLQNDTVSMPQFIVASHLVEVKLMD